MAALARATASLILGERAHRSLSSTGARPAAIGGRSRAQAVAPRQRRRGVTVWAAAAGAGADEQGGAAVSAPPLEVVEPTVVAPPGQGEPVGKKKVVVLGGNGFVGSAVCKEAVVRGYDVVSINRSGRPAILNSDWTDEVLWVPGDVFDEDTWTYTLQGAWCVISCVGGFATTVADMERICGDATIAGVEAAAAAAVPRFVFVSVHDYNIPSVLKDNSGYFSGKKRAEEAVMRCFPQTGTVLRPGFIYGDRVVPELGITVPLGLVGEPVQKILALNPFQDITKVAEMLPGSDFALKTPVSVESVAACALSYAMDDVPSPGVVMVDSIA